ncbi:hypothetical protein XA68_12034 [Ophiocordyceps unilateralis]|uniref:Uncharacterized protein n=1 Tax=Ophiocordyceps unilateralis TaxID=268505 RepID=A0A2A9PFI9_OPHUN|nr:hypothetical protein XA68_12034 [Ophiocordyceps unilateralis]
MFSHTPLATPPPFFLPFSNEFIVPLSSVYRSTSSVDCADLVGTPLRAYTHKNYTSTLEQASPCSHRNAARRLIDSFYNPFHCGLHAAHSRRSLRLAAFRHCVTEDQQSLFAAQPGLPPPQKKSLIPLHAPQSHPC